jgi:hypothetical protein
VVVFADAAHCVAREAIVLGVNGERARLRFEFVQSVLGTYPHRARLIEVHRVHPIVAQGPGKIYVVFVLGELASRWIETIQTSGVSAKPQCPFWVLDQFKIGDSPLRLELINREASGCRIETIQTIIGGDPERSVMTLLRRSHTNLTPMLFPLISPSRKIVDARLIAHTSSEPSSPRPHPIEALGVHIPGRAMFAYTTGIWMILAGAAIPGRRSKFGGTL